LVGYFPFTYHAVAKKDKHVALFVGEFEQSIDAKHRLAIPAALREQIDPQEDGAQFLLVLAADRHLWLYPDLTYRRLLTRLRRSPLPSRDSQDVGLLFAFARLVRPDKQGRVVLPEASMQRASIADSVVLVGQLDHIEIWPKNEWEQHVSRSLPRYDEVLARAAERLERPDALTGQEAV